MAYIGNSPGVASQRVTSTFTATAGQTTFTPISGYTLGYCDVYYNGVKLVDGDDYTASNGVTVVLTNAAAVGDSVEIVTHFPRGLSDGYTQSEANARYAQRSNNLSDLSSASTARTNLGLGTAATQNTGVFLQTANNLSDVTASTARSNLGIGNVENKSSATIRGEITSGNVTGALGYTPVNKAGDSHSGVHRFNSYFAVGKGGSNNDQITWNAIPDNSGNYTPHWAGSGDAGGVILGLPYGGGGGLELRILRHGTDGSAKLASAYPVRWAVDDSGRVTMPFQPAFCVTSPNNGDVNAVQKFQSVLVNRGNHYSTSTGYFTAPVAGVYQFNWHILSATLDGYHYGYLAKNGNIVVYAQAYTASGLPATGTTVGGSALIELAAGDWVGYFHYGGSYTDAYNGNYSVFSGLLVG